MLFKFVQSESKDANFPPRRLYPQSWMAAGGELAFLMRESYGYDALATLACAMGSFMILGIR